MLSKQTLFLYKLHFTVGYRLCFLLYKWDHWTQTLTASNNIFRRLIAVLIIVLLWLNFLNLIGSIVEGVLCDSSPSRSVRLTIDILFAALYACLGSAAVIYYLRRHEVAYVITETLKLNRQLTARELNGKLPKSDGCGVIAPMYPGTVFYPVVMAGFFLVNSEASRHMYRFIPVEYRNNWTLASWALFEAVIVAAGMVPALMGMFVMIPPTRCTTFWLQHFNRRANENDRDLRNMEGQKIKLLLNTFRVMRILNVCTNGALSDFVWPNQCFLLVFFLVFGNYGMVKLGDKLPIFVFTMFPVLAATCFVCMFSLFPMQAKLTSESALMLQSCLKADGVTMVEKKEIRAIKPIGIRIGSVFVIKKTTALTLFMLASNLTVNSLLLH